MRKLYLILLVLVVLASGCVQNQSDKPGQESSTVSVEDLVQNSSFSYDKNSSKMLENTGSSVRAPVKFEFVASDQDDTYALNPGLFLKIFDKKGEEIKSKVIATEKEHEISLELQKVSLSDNTTFTSCFATKDFHENNTWSLEDRNNSKVYCQEGQLTDPEINITIEPEPVSLYFEEVSWDSSVAETERFVNITNTGDVKIAVAPADQFKRDLEDEVSNGRIQLENQRGTINVGLPGRLGYEIKLMSGETVQIPVGYYAGRAYRYEDREPQTIEKEVKLLINSNPPGDIDSALNSFPLEVRIE